MNKEEYIKQMVSTYTPEQLTSLMWEYILSYNKLSTHFGYEQDSRIELQQENKQLKENLKNTYETSQELLAEKQKIINKAIKKIEFEWQEIITKENYQNHLYDVDGLVIKEILEILKGDSNES